MGIWLRSIFAAFAAGLGALHLAAGAGMALLPVAVALGGECPPEGDVRAPEWWWERAGAEAVAACFTDEAAVNPPVESGVVPDTPLFRAARFSRDPAVVAALLAAGAQVIPPVAGGGWTQLAGGGWTPWADSALHVAARYNENPAVVAELARAGTAYLDEEGNHPLHYAAAFNPNPAVAGVLLEAGASVNSENRFDRNTPLHHALRSNRNPAVALLLIEAGAAVDAENIDRHGGYDGGDTPLHYAARYGAFPAVVAALVEAGADVNARNRDGSLFGDWVSSDDPGTDALLAATGETPLHHAAQYNANPAVVEALVEAGADVGATGGDWLGTPLHDAAEHNPNPAVVEALLRAGAEVDARGTGGMTPLHDAAYANPNPAVVEALLHAGAEVDARGGGGMTPLHAAASANPDPAVVEALLRAGAEVDARDAKGMTPLHDAAYANPNPAVVEALLRAGAEVDARDADGATPLHYAAGRSWTPDVVRVLAAAGADVGTEVSNLTGPLSPYYGSTPLQIAVGFNTNPAVVEALIDAGADLGAEAVRSAEREGRTAVAAMLRAAGAERRLGWGHGEWRLVRSGLVAAGYDPGPAHGRMEKRARGAIRRWQAARGEPATGYLDAAAAQGLLASGRAREEKRRAAVEESKFRDCPECPELVVVPSGSFRMGSLKSEAGRDDDEGPVRRVTIARPFAVGVHEVTVGEFARFVSATGRAMGRAMGNSCRAMHDNHVYEERGDPGFGQTDEHPVVCVSWWDAQAYVEWLSKETGAGYRLLSESEWEYVARAGTGTARFWGECEAGQCRHANGADASTDFDERAGCNDGHARTSPVGSYEANGFGLRDVLGNVWEWVEDCWNESYAGAPADGSAWASGDCGLRVLRGGSWLDIPIFLRSASRGGSTAGDRSNYNGFRVARTLTP